MSKISDSLKKIAQKLAPAEPPQNLEWDMTGRDWIAIWTAAFAAFMALLDIQVTNSSLREIQGSLGIDMSEGGWISTAYLIAEIIIIPLAPLLVDTLGLKNYLVTGSALFALTSALCATSWNLPSIAIFRFMQGLAGGTLIPVILQMILIYMPVHRRSVGLAIFGLVATLAPSLGPSIGGFLATNFGWRWIFLVNFFPSAGVIYLCRRYFPPSYVSWGVLKKADWWGAFFLCSALGCLTFILEEGSNRGWLQDGLILFCALVTVTGLPAFIFWETVTPNPLMRLDLFKEKSFTISTLITFIAAQCLYGGMYALSIFLGGIRGYTPSEIGGILAWAGIPQLLVIPFLPLLMKRIDPRVLAVCGLLLFSASNFLNTGINEDYGGQEFRFTLILRAISQPFFVIPLSALAIQNILPSRAGAASSVINMVRNLGGSVGIAIVSFIVKNHVSAYASNLSVELYAGSPIYQGMKSAFKYGLWFWGMDPTQSETVTSMFLNMKIMREAYFHCFIEAFGILFLELLVATALTLFIPFNREEMDRHGSGAVH